jgi:hypothetical protein
MERPFGLRISARRRLKHPSIGRAEALRRAEIIGGGRLMTVLVALGGHLITVL